MLGYDFLFKFLLAHCERLWLSVTGPPCIVWFVCLTIFISNRIISVTICSWNRYRTILPWELVAIVRFVVLLLQASVWFMSFQGFSYLKVIYSICTCMPCFLTNEMNKKRNTYVLWWIIIQMYCTLLVYFQCIISTIPM